MAESNRRTGTVKWFSAQKGFGFIAPDDGGEDLFVHQTSIRSDGFRTLSEGQVVEFVIDYGEDGRTKAVDVANLTRSPRRPGFGRGRGGGGGGGAGRGGWGRGGGYGGYGGGGYNTGTRGGRSGGGGGGECYNCGRMGHLARDCYQGSSGDGVGAGAGGGGGGGARRYGGGGRGYGGVGGGGRGCYNCGEEGHLARECPNDQK